MADNKRKTPIYLIDTQSPFYEPRSRRILICLAAGLWAGMELWHRQPFWAVIASAVAVYCFYVLIWAYKPPAPPPPPVYDTDDDVEDEQAEAAARAEGAGLVGEADKQTR